MVQGEKCPIGVVIPAHRSQDVLAATLDRVSNQTVAPRSVIVVVDGPDPETESVARSAPIDCEILVLPEGTGGPSQPRNRGAERLLAKGPLEGVWFLDSDDLPDTRFLSVVSRVLERNPDAGFVTTGFESWFSDATVPDPSPDPGDDPIVRAIDLDGYLASTGSILPSFTVFRPRAWAKVREDGTPFDESVRINNDYDTFIRMLHLGTGVRIDWVGGIYRVHPAGISASGVGLQLCRSHCNESLARWFEEQGDEDRARQFRRSMGTSKRSAAKMLWRRNLPGDRKFAIGILIQSIVEDQDVRSAPMMLALPVLAGRTDPSASSDVRESYLRKTAPE